jgi:hypothetical protein
VGALGHFLERQGIPTVGISLVREHTEIVRPPRALWVTFELGRPLGRPDDPSFQRRVVKAALDALARTDSPLIVDYPEHVDEEPDMTGLSCPVQLGSTEVNSLGAEIDRLSTWYDRAIEARGRTTVGVSGLTMAEAGTLLIDALSGELPPAQALKEAIDDLKAYYLEASSVFPGAGPPKARTNWLWGETEFGAAMLALQPKLVASDDAQHKILGNLTLIPATERHRLLPT